MSFSEGEFSSFDFDSQGYDSYTVDDDVEVDTESTVFRDFEDIYSTLKHYDTTETSSTTYSSDIAHTIWLRNKID